MDASAAAFQLAAILFILGVLFLALSVWLRLRWVSHPVDTAAVARTVRINLVGYALQLGGAIVFLAKVALPVATVLLVVSGTWLVLCVQGRPRRVHVESDTIFRCTREEAFALLGDPRKEPLYFPETERTEVGSAGEMAVGTVIRGWVRIPRDSSHHGLYLVAEEVITEYDPPRICVTDGTHVTAVYDSVIEFEPAVTGGVFFRGEAERRILKSRQAAWERARLILEHPAA